MSMNVASTLTSATSNVQLDINKVQTELATGLKTLNPAQQGVVTRLSSQATGYKAVGNNITQAKNVINVAQTGLTSIASVITKMQDLANQATGGTMTTTDMASLNATFQSLLSQVTNIANSASVNGANLLTGALSVQTGLLATDTTAVATAGITTATTGVVAVLGAVTVTSATNAASAITALTTALTSVSASQSSLNASTVGLDSQSTQAASLVTNLNSTIDSIQKVDAPAAQVELAALNTQQSVDYYLINQMNTEAQAMLTIFR